MASEGLQELLDLKNNPMLDRRKNRNMWAALVYSFVKNLEPLAREPCLNVVEHGEPCVTSAPLRQVSAVGLCLTCRIRKAIQDAILDVPSSKWEV